MKILFPLFFTATSIILLMPSCNSRPDNKSGLAALGIYSTDVYAGDIHDISIVREVDGVRTEWLTCKTEAGDLTVHIQLGLPGKTMRVAIGRNSSAAASTFETDVINDYPFVFNVTSIRKPGEYMLMQTKDDKLANQNKILLITK